MTNFEMCKRKFNDIIRSLPELDENDKVPGIYCLYLDSALIVDQIPIYIGQSKNMYRRLLQHRKGLNDILKLNGVEITILHSGPCSYYGCKTLSGPLYGRMFNAILENGILNPVDVTLKARVLERCEICDLKTKEDDYIKEYGADAYGFNQPIVSEWLHQVQRYPSKHGVLRILDWVMEYISTRDVDSLDAGESYVFELALSAAQSVRYIYEKMTPDIEIDERFRDLGPFLEEYRAMFEVPMGEDEDDADLTGPANSYYQRAIHWNPAGELMPQRVEKDVLDILCRWVDDYREILRQFSMSDYKLKSWGAQLHCQISLNQQPVNIERVINYLDSVKEKNILELQRKTLRTFAERHSMGEKVNILIDDFGLGWSL